MATNSKTNWISLIIAFVVGGVVVVGLRCNPSNKPPAEPAPKPATTAPPPGQSRVPCGNVRVDVSINNPDLVSPDPFVLCQDNEEGGHFRVTWRKARGEPASLTQFTANFEDGSPFEDGQGNEVKIFEWPEHGTSVSTVRTKNLNLGDGQFAYYKYTVTLCCDAQGNEKTMDPGGIIVR